MLWKELKTESWEAWALVLSIHFSNKHVLSTYCVLPNILSPGNPQMNKTDKSEFF